MHLPLTLVPDENPRADEARQLPSHRRHYSEEELEAVFRQTYGISKRESQRFRKNARVIRADNVSGPGVKRGYNNAQAEEVMIVDGYNMIFAWEELTDMASLNLESA